MQQLQRNVDFTTGLLGAKVLWLAFVTWDALPSRAQVQMTSPFSESKPYFQTTVWVSSSQSTPPSQFLLTQTTTFASQAYCEKEHGVSHVFPRSWRARMRWWANATIRRISGTAHANTSHMLSLAIMQYKHCHNTTTFSYGRRYTFSPPKRTQRISVASPAKLRRNALTAQESLTHFDFLGMLTVRNPNDMSKLGIAW